MRIIKIDAISSTNDYIKKKINPDKKKTPIVVYTFNQKMGKGQRGNTWVSEPGKNIALSLAVFPKNFMVKDLFYMSIFTSLFLFKFFKKQKIKKLKIKWPNDILSEKKKFCGILCESVIKKNIVKKLIIGIGINVNQTDFKGLKNASSIKLTSHKSINLDSLSEKLIQEIDKNLSFFKSSMLIKKKKILSEYLTNLFGFKLFESYRLSTGKKIKIKIIGVNNDGSIKTENENGDIKKYYFKEVQLIY